MAARAAESNTTIRIGIDCRLGGPRHAGIGRYIENLILRLPLLAPTITWVFFYHDHEQKEAWTAQLRAKNVEWVWADTSHYTLTEQWQLPDLLNKAQLTILHVPHFNIPLAYRGTLIVTIHDLLWHEYRGPSVTTLPRWQYWLKYAAYRWVTSQAVKRAAAILVPAETIRDTLDRYYPHNLTKIFVTKEGVSYDFKPMKMGKMKQSPKKRLVYVGSLYPHKNLEVVFKALMQLPEYELAVVGARTVFQQQMREAVALYGVESQVSFLGYVPDTELTDLLHDSTALIQPSLSEGFGLTGVEAMAAGVPVLASDIPIFREVYQDAALYFDPRSPEAVAEAVAQLEKVDTPQLQQNLRRVAAQYSWDTMAEETLAVYNRVLAV